MRKSILAILFGYWTENETIDLDLTPEEIGFDAFVPSRGCSGDTAGGEECFYPTGIVISDIVVLGNDIDLFHCEDCTGNTWEGDTFETADGVDIYTADPTTAREFLASVDSAAVHVQCVRRIGWFMSDERQAPDEDRIEPRPGMRRRMRR